MNAHLGNKCIPTSPKKSTRTGPKQMSIRYHSATGPTKSNLNGKFLAVDTSYVHTSSIWNK
ncbi:hypothetical protein BPOR_0988g00010 [Botrytis porri]|uniref:Uncharacterized protein n=1 Tax=Botrytis porri TaxID=87229 RepID=A0A4Z1KL12_9HELO|nr:hypothetical protein BPOR_0988g00010 [Botrytis porri]